MFDHSVTEFCLFVCLPFPCKSDPKKKKSVVLFTQLDDIVHEQTIICRQLINCWSRGGVSANEKEEKFASNDNKIF